MPLPWLLTGTDEEQRAQERQATAHRNPTVKHSLTLFNFHQEALYFLVTFCHKGGIVRGSTLIETAYPGQAP